MPVAKNAAAAVATIVFFMVLSPLLIDFAVSRSCETTVE
jgi:uncharacterized membrane protein YtjA (UPF0391 family)